MVSQFRTLAFDRAGPERLRVGGAVQTVRSIGHGSRLALSDQPSSNCRVRRELIKAVDGPALCAMFETAIAA
jgi:hypothetical protein